MYAVIEDSGSQYKVSEGDVIKVDLRELAKNARKIEFDKVLMIGGEDKPVIGAPLVKGAKVTAELLSQERGDKITIIKFKRRGNYRRKRGHRQGYLKVKITSIAA